MGVLDDGGSPMESDNFKPASGLAPFDAFPKTKPMYSARLRTGSHWTIVVLCLTAYFVQNEFSRWLTGTVSHQFTIEKGIGHEMQVNMDIVVAMACDDVRLNVRDMTGDHIAAGTVVKKDDTLWSHWTGKVRTKSKTRTIASIDGMLAGEGGSRGWFGLGLDEDVHDYLKLARSSRQYSRTPRLRGRKPDACRMYGSFEMNKVRANVHITARGQAYPEFGPRIADEQVNMTHQINELSFGPFFPGLENPLDGAVATTSRTDQKFQYFLSLVPTIYTTDASKLGQIVEAAALGAMSGSTHDHYGQHDQLKHRQTGKKNKYVKADSAHTVFTNQYSVNSYSRHTGGMAIPGVFFTLDYEPIMLMVVESKSSFVLLLVRLVNVVSGIFVGLGWCAQLTDWMLGLVGRRDSFVRRGILDGKLRL